MKRVRGGEELLNTSLSGTSLESLYDKADSSKADKSDLSGLTIPGEKDTSEEDAKGEVTNSLKEHEAATTLPHPRGSVRMGHLETRLQEVLRLLYTKDGVLNVSDAEFTVGTLNATSANITTFIAPSTVAAGDDSYTLYGPNTSWNSYLYVGASPTRITSTAAAVLSTNGNLHLDSATGRVMYLNYYSETDIYANSQGGTMYVNYLGRKAHEIGHLVGSYNSVGANSLNSNPIYTIGSNYNPASTTLSNMYGIGYSHTNASFISASTGSGWGAYIAADGDARIFLNASLGSIDITGRYRAYGSGMRLEFDQPTASPVYIRWHMPGVLWWTLGPSGNTFNITNTSDHTSAKFIFAGTGNFTMYGYFISAYVLGQSLVYGSRGTSTTGTFRSDVNPTYLSSQSRGTTSSGYYVSSYGTTFMTRWHSPTTGGLRTYTYGMGHYVYGGNGGW